MRDADLGLALDSAATIDPFATLGIHNDGSGSVVRVYRPQATEVAVVETSGKVTPLRRVDDSGLFTGTFTKPPFAYRLRVNEWGTVREIEDPYRFGPLLGEMDEYLLAEGTHVRLADVLGAHVRTIDGVTGVAFAVWAPNARRVAVVGDFNGWDGRVHPMRLRVGSGIWELFVPGIGPGERYKYELHSASGERLPLKADPLAFAMERSPGTASIVAPPLDFAWSDDAWLAKRAGAIEQNGPVSIYEVHLGSWKRSEGNRYLTYRELAADLIPYVREMGFTHVELLPISEYPFDGSWGYQPIGLFAPTSRFGTPADFAAFVDAAHAAGIGVIVDWVPGHFPTDEYGLARFDGTHLYEHADPRQGYQPDWNTLVYNFGRTEVANFLVNNALFWLRRYHIDGLRVDAVASMLYLDYSRKDGEWIPNVYGGRENLEAIAFLRRTNETAAAEVPGSATIAEESTAWPQVSRPVRDGGLGFDYKWNMGWMHDTLAYMHEEPIHRSWHHDKITFGLLYAFSENFILPLSHDEVVHGKGSLLAKMPGDAWQQFANLRAYFGFMWAHPGKKLLFMGGEFAQGREWNYDASLDWHQLEIAEHAGVQRLVRDLNHTYRARPALYARDAAPDGFRWLIADDRDASAYAFVRFDGPAFVIAASNFTPVVRHQYRLGVPEPGTYAETINTDAGIYGGSGVTNPPVSSEPTPWQGFDHSIHVTLPPLATVWFERT